MLGFVLNFFPVFSNVRVDGVVEAGDRFVMYDLIHAGKRLTSSQVGFAALPTTVFSHIH